MHLRLNVPLISSPFPFTAGSHSTFGATYVVDGADPIPKMSPSKPPPAGTVAAGAGGALVAPVPPPTSN